MHVLYVVCLLPVLYIQAALWLFFIYRQYNACSLFRLPVLYMQAVHDSAARRRRCSSSVARGSAGLALSIVSSLLLCSLWNGSVSQVELVDCFNEF